VSRRLPIPRVGERLVSTTATGRYRITTLEIDARRYIQASLSANRAIIVFVSVAIDISSYLLVIIG